MSVLLQPSKKPTGKTPKRNLTSHCHAIKLASARSHKLERVCLTLLALPNKQKLSFDPSILRLPLCEVRQWQKLITLLRQNNTSTTRNHTCIHIQTNIHKAYYASYVCVGHTCECHVLKHAYIYDAPQNRQCHALDTTKCLA